MEQLSLKYEVYKSLISFEKEIFFDNALNFYGEIINYQSFFYAFLEDESNSFLRRKAIETLCQLSHIGKIRVAFVKEFLLNLSSNESVLVNVSRIKNLCFLYGGEAEIKDLFKTYCQNENTDISAEAYLRLGQIVFFDSSLDNNNTFLESIISSKKYFGYSANSDENRIDARFYESVCDIIISILGGKFDEANRILEFLSNNLFQRSLFIYYPSKLEFDLSLYKILLNLKLISQKVSLEEDWDNYKKEFTSLMTLVNDYFIVEVSNSKTLNQRLLQLKDTYFETITKNYYRSNFSARIRKIDSIIGSLSENENELKDFLIDLKSTAIVPIEKKNSTVNINLLANLYKILPEIEPKTLEKEVNLLINSGKDESEACFEILIPKILSESSYKTGYIVGEEIYYDLTNKIRELLPKYSLHKLYTFFKPLEDVIRFLLSSTYGTKANYSVLYSDYKENKLEKDFQDLMIRDFQIGNFAQKYSYEGRIIGGSRVDIVFTHEDIIFPIEIKKTNKKPTTESIRSDYLAQAQTYTYPFHQLGIFVVFDLSESTKTPLEDVRSYFDVQTFNSCNNQKFPDYVVTVVIPANRTSPSQLSTYN